MPSMLAGTHHEFNFMKRMNILIPPLSDALSAKILW